MFDKVDVKTIIQDIANTKNNSDVIILHVIVGSLDHKIMPTVETLEAYQKRIREQLDNAGYKNVVVITTGPETEMEFVK